MNCYKRSDPKKKKSDLQLLCVANLFNLQPPHALSFNGGQRQIHQALSIYYMDICYQMIETLRNNNIRLL
jgi:hypothetical protein